MSENTEIGLLSSFWIDFAFGEALDELKKNSVDKWWFSAIAVHHIKMQSGKT